MDSNSDARMSNLSHAPVPVPDQPANLLRDTQQARAGEEGSGYGVAGSPVVETIDSDVLVFETLVSDNITLIFQCQNLQIIDASTTSKLSSGLSALQTYFHQASEELKTRLAANVVRQPAMLGTIWDFSTDIYQSLGSGVSRILGFCLIMMRNCLFGWCEHSQDVRQVLAERGVIEKLACELGELRTIPEIDEFTKYLILLDISLEYTLAQYTPSLEQFKDIGLVNILQAYVLCPNDNIRTMTKLALSHMLPILGEKDLPLLKLTEKEASCFCETLATATTSDEHTGKLFDIELSALDLLNAMLGLVAYPSNQELMLRGDVNIVDFIAVLLATFGEPEIKAAALLLWRLFTDPCIRTQILTSKSFIIDQIHELHLNPDEEIKRLGSCILEASECAERKDIPTLLGLAETHYKYCKYETCIKLCDHLQDITNEDNNSTLLLKGKALFHVFQQQQQGLQVCTLSAKEYHLKRALCYTNAMEVIRLLGTALDCGYIDEEGSFFLDHAMIDHLREVNSKDRHRCLLCLKKTKLRRSHAWPNSLLVAFTSGLRTDTGKTRKVFDSKKIGNSKAAGELTSWMLCGACEHILSSQAETDFAKKFFCKLYDPSCPSHDKPKQAQSIEYEEWLYCFCISMVFRGLVRVGILGHSYTGNIYKIFQQCRRFLLQSPNDRTISQTEVPQIGLLIGPTEASVTDQKAGFVNQVLHMPGLFVMSRNSLADGSIEVPPKHTFFLAHCGIINIVVELNKAQPPSISPSSYVSCRGGKYCIPVDEERAQSIPKGIWNVFLKLGKDFETKWLERSGKYVLGKINSSYVEPKPAQRDTFMLLAAAKSDVKSVYSQVYPSEDAAFPKVVNLLPQQFGIYRKQNQPSSITLPHGHKILLHRHFMYSEGLNETLFLAVGTENDYTIEKPYVIFHHAIPGLQFHIGFFISPIDFTAQDFLPDSDPKFTLDKIVQSCNARSIIHEVIPSILEEKGFSNYYSILHRIKDQSELPNLDRKCANPNRCWYCQDLCENCLKPATAGLTYFARNKTLLRFCSESCNQEFQPQPLSSTSPLAVVSETFLTILSSCVPSGHRELFRVHAHGTTPKQEPFKITLSVCIADGSDCFPRDRPYIMYHLRSIFHQQFLEFFISPKLIPEEPVPYYTDDASVSAVNKLKADKYIHKMLKGALSSQGFSELSTLLQFEKESRASAKSGGVQLHDDSLEDVTSEITSLQLSEVAPVTQELLAPTVSVSDSACSDQKLTFTKHFQDGLQLIVAYQSEAKNGSPRSMDLSIRINQSVNAIYSILSNCSFQLVGELGDRIAEVPGAAKTLLVFTQEIYDSLLHGVDLTLIDSLLKVRMFLSQAPDFSHSLANTMAESGWIFQMIHEIQDVKDTLEQNEPQKHLLSRLIVLNFEILLRCSWSKKHLVQFEQTKFLESIQTYTESPVASIRALAVFTLGSLVQLLSEEQCKLLELAEKDLELIVVALTHAIDSSYPAVECFDLKFSRERVVFMLSNICISPQNRQKVVHLGILDTISFLLDKGQMDEQERTLELLWSLAEEPETREQMMKKCHTHCLLLDMLSSSVVPALQVLSRCILWTTNPGTETEIEACLEYIHGCYQYQKYGECIEWCDKLIKASGVATDQKADAKLYKGKALFHHYCKQQKLLKSTYKSMSHEKFQEQQQLCHSDSRQVIVLLGYALDQKLIKVEDEASKMLDSSMINYIWETNDLKSCERCLLCRKRAELRKSHLCPKVLLDGFAEMVSPEDRKIFLFDRHQKGILRSSKEVTLWMFCSECEGLLSGHSETQFARDFFERIYNKSDLEMPEEIRYGKWLYEFTLGIVFHVLIQATSSFTNEKDAYQLFLQCRHCLQNVNNLDGIDSKPLIAILVGPTKLRASESAGYLNQVLNTAFVFSKAPFRLSDGLINVPITTEFYLAKFGIIHFIVRLNTADGTVLPPELYINPLGGTYKVLGNASRQSIFPAGILSLLKFHADELMKANREFPVHYVLANQEKVHPSHKAQETVLFDGAAPIGIGALLSEELKSLNTFMSVNLLPQEFVLRHLSETPGTLILPDGHKILLHSTFRQSAGEVEETIFLAVDSSDYSTGEPYIIYSCSESSLQLSIGLFISSNDLSVMELLPGSPKGPSMKGEIFVKKAKERLSKLLPGILKMKGVFSLHSLKLRMFITGEIPCADSKCIPRCWYCNDLCDNCLLPAVVGLEVVTKEDVLLKFCSDQCQRACCGLKELVVNAELPRLGDQRELLMRVCAAGANRVVSHFTVQMQIYQSSGSYKIPADRCYVTYQFRSPFSQELLEFFISSNLSPIGPLPHLTSEQAIQSLQLIRESGLVQSILQKAFEVVGIKDLCALVHPSQR